MNAFQPVRIVERCFDAEAANAVANHPSVLPGLSLGFDSVDLTGLVENQRNLCFMGEHGGAILVWSGPGIYDAHDFILPEGRGAWAKQACIAILREAFTAHKARMVWAQTPFENRACRMFNRILGFKSEGLDSAVLVPGQDERMVELFVMEKAPCR